MFAVQQTEENWHKIYAPFGYHDGCRKGSKSKI